MRVATGLAVVLGVVGVACGHAARVDRRPTPTAAVSSPGGAEKVASVMSGVAASSPTSLEHNRVAREALPETVAHSGGVGGRSVHTLSALFAVVSVVALAAGCVRCGKHPRQGPKYRYSYGTGRIPDYDPSKAEESLAMFSVTGNTTYNPLARHSITSVDAAATAGIVLINGPMVDKMNDDLTRKRSETAFERPDPPQQEPLRDRAVTAVTYGGVASRRTLYEEDVKQTRADTGAVVAVADGIKTVELTLNPGETIGIETAPRENLRGIAITQIVPGGGADRTAAFSLGEVLLTINGRGVLKASHEAVQLALSVCSGKVHFELLPVSRGGGVGARHAGSQLSTKKKQLDFSVTSSETEPETAGRQWSDSQPAGRKMSLKRGMMGLDEASTDPSAAASTATAPTEDVAAPAGEMTVAASSSATLHATAPDEVAPAVPRISITDEGADGEVEEEVTGFADLKEDGTAGDKAVAPEGGAASAVAAPAPPAKPSGSGRRKANPAPPAPMGVAPAPDLTDDAKAQLLSALDAEPRPSLRLSGPAGPGGPPLAKRKKSKTIKKEAGKLLVRLKQLVDGCDSPVDLPPYRDVRTALITEFGKDFFDAQEMYVKSWLKEIGMAVFEGESSSDDNGATVAPTVTMSRAKSIKGRALGNVFKKSAMRSASSWFKEVQPNGKKKRRFVEMKGPELTLSERVRKRMVLLSSILITPGSQIQSHGYSLFVSSGETRTELVADSEEQCQEWYRNLRATYVELCESIDLNAFQEVAAQPPPKPEPVEEPGPAAAAPEAVVVGESTAAEPEGKPAEEAAAPTEQEETPEEKAERRAKMKAELAAKRAAAKAARQGGVIDLLAWIDKLDEEAWPRANA
mmetsp:Transcript_12662/g.32389  ORF Transcript_12662/g.32389 Transcript_12662/m.32389 type:complete len:861 (+) Transcript_12662:214-2796(+)